MIKDDTLNQSKEVLIKQRSDVRVILSPPSNLNLDFPIFLVFITIAIIKMYKLKAENKKLMETNAFKDVDESYKDFTGGHLYGDN